MEIIVFFLGSLVAPLLLPLIVGFLISKHYWKDQAIRFIGLFNLQFIVTYIIYFIQWLSWPIIDVFDGSGRPYLFVAVLAVIPAIGITLIFFYVSRRLLILKWTRLFLIGNLLYWLNIVLIHGDFVLGFSRWFAIAIMVLSPSFCAILSWNFARKNSNLITQY